MSIGVFCREGRVFSVYSPKIFYYMGIGASIFCGVFSGCHPSVKNSIQSSTEHALVISEGKSGSISLNSNPTTGYSWFLMDIENNPYITFVDEHFHTSKTTLSGAPGVQEFVFKGKSIGETVLKFEYKRPWKKNIAPIQVRTQYVIIE